MTQQHIHALTVRHRWLFSNMYILFLHYIQFFLSSVHSKHSEDVYLRSSVICDHIFRRGKPAGKLSVCTCVYFSQTLLTHSYLHILCDRLTVWPRSVPTWLMLPVRSFLLPVWLKSFGKWWEKQRGKDSSETIVDKHWKCQLLITCPVCHIFIPEAEHGIGNDPGQCSRDVPS